MPLVIGLVVRQGLTVAPIANTVGICVTLFVTRLLSKLLYGVAPHDPFVFGAVSLTLIAVGGVEPASSAASNAGRSARDTPHGINFRMF